MRLWSIHPKYLDSIGLVAVWREGLLALEVLKGNTKGYRNHPQLNRFKATKRPIETMKNYLWAIFVESIERGYHFNPGKIVKRKKCLCLTVTTGQLKYEIEHLRRKLMIRNPKKYRTIEKLRMPKPHTLFRVVSGKVEEWETVRKKESLALHKQSYMDNNKFGYEENIKRKGKKILREEISEMKEHNKTLQLTPIKRC